MYEKISFFVKIKLINWMKKVTIYIHIFESYYKLDHDRNTGGDKLKQNLIIFFLNYFFIQPNFEFSFLTVEV